VLAAPTLSQSKERRQVIIIIHAHHAHDSCACGNFDSGGGESCDEAQEEQLAFYSVYRTLLQQIPDQSIASLAPTMLATDSLQEKSTRKFLLGLEFVCPIVIGCF
jgi:hypothetical protein